MTAKRRPVDPPPPAPADRTTKPAWVALEVYNAFVMGGSVWQWIRFEMHCVEFKIDRRDITCVAYEAAGQWNVHEKRTGGRMGGGATLEAAIAQTHENVDTTDDLEDQIAKTPDVMTHKEVAVDQAMRYLRNAK